MYECLPGCIYIHCMSAGAHGDEGSAAPLELELWIDMNHLVRLETKLGSPGKEASALYC